MASQEELNEVKGQVANLAEMLQNLSLQISNPEKQKQMDLIQESLGKLSNNFRFQEISSQGVSVDKDLLPQKFNPNDIPKFKATDNPYFHLRAFETVMSIKGIDRKAFHSVFSLSLEAVCQQWYFSLDKEKTSSWESIVSAFIERYKCNIQIETDHRELEILKQKENEGFI